MVEACGREGRRRLAWQQINQGDRQWRALFKKDEAITEDPLNNCQSLQMRSNARFRHVSCL